MEINLEIMKKIESDYRNYEDRKFHILQKFDEENRAIIDNYEHMLDLASENYMEGVHLNLFEYKGGVDRIEIDGNKFRLKLRIHGCMGDSDEINYAYVDKRVAYDWDNYKNELLQTKKNKEKQNLKNAIIQMQQEIKEAEQRLGDE